MGFSVNKHRKTKMRKIKMKKSNNKTRKHKKNMRTMKIKKGGNCEEDTINEWKEFKSIDGRPFYWNECSKRFQTEKPIPSSASKIAQRIMDEPKIGRAHV